MIEAFDTYFWRIKNLSIWYDEVITYFFLNDIGMLNRVYYNIKSKITEIVPRIRSKYSPVMPNEKKLKNRIWPTVNNLLYKTQQSVTLALKHLNRSSGTVPSNSSFWPSNVPWSSNPVYRSCEALPLMSRLDYDWPSHLIPSQPYEQRGRGLGVQPVSGGARTLRYEHTYTIHAHKDFVPSFGFVWTQVFIRMCKFILILCFFFWVLDFFFWFFNVCCWMSVVVFYKWLY